MSKTTISKNINNTGQDSTGVESSKQLSFSRLWVETPHSKRRRSVEKIQNHRAGVSNSCQASLQLRRPEPFPDGKEVAYKNVADKNVAGKDSCHHKFASPNSNDTIENITGASSAQTIPRLRELLNRNWPEAAYGGRNGTAHKFRIHLPDLTAIFPPTGIAYGQLIEISGGISSGKTTLLQKILSAIEPAPIIGYLDFSCSFFPPGAEAAGIDLQRLKLLRPDSLQDGIRIADALLQQRQINCVVFDLVGINEPLPRILLHRLRQNIIRGEALGFFLTETGSRHLPASYTSLKLQTDRAANNEIAITVARSRIGHEGARGRMSRV